MSHPNVWIVPVAVSLLLIYALVALIALASPSNDPQRGMANGFIMLVLMVLLVFGGLLWLGTHPYRPVLLWITSALLAYPAVMWSAQQIYLLIRNSGGE